MTFFDYLLRANGCLAVLFGLYWLLFRRHTFFGLNRTYLLLTLLASALLPLIQLPSAPLPELALPTINLFDTQIVTETSAETGPDWMAVLGWLYGAGVLVCAGRLGWSGWQLARLIGAGERSRWPGFTLVLLNDDRLSPFSFFRFLVMSRRDFETQPALILQHEQVHIRQGHSADVLLAEVVRVACWFNPVAWWLPRALQQNHEFLADQLATDPTTRADYARFLVGYALGTAPDTLVNSFISVSQLKSRIIMLQKTPTHRRALLGYALVLPLGLGLLMCTQQNRTDAPNPANPLSSQAQITTSEPAISGEVFTIVEDTPTFPGGMNALGQYLGQNLKYPEAAQEANVTGKVYTEFVVTDKGEVTAVKVLKGIGFGCDEEAARMIRAMPRWTPGHQADKPVNVRYTLPIAFMLERKKQAEVELSPKKMSFDHLTINGRVASSKDIDDLLPMGRHFQVDFDEVTRTMAIKTSSKP